MSKRAKSRPPEKAPAEKKPPHRKWKPPRVPPPDSDVWPEEYRGKNWKSIYATLFAGKCQLCAYSCPLSKWRQGEDKFRGVPRLLLCANHPACPGELHEVLPVETCRNFKPKRWGRICTNPPKRCASAPPSESDPDIRRIPVGKGLFALVDAADYEKVRKYRWCASVHGRNVYAVTTINGRSVTMHRLLMKPRKGYVVDHIDGNGLNNRRCNLQVCTRAQNLANQTPRGGASQYVGVYRYRDRWAANVSRQGKCYYVGTFDDEVEAAKARDRKAYELHGEYAYLNFPDDFPPKE